MSPCSPADYKKYLYAKGVHRIRRIEDTLDRLDLDDEIDNDIKCSLDSVQSFLYLAAFVEDDTTMKNEVASAIDLESRSDLNTYSDGRPVNTTIRWDGGYVTHVWHPDPMHADNCPGQIRELEEESWPCRRKLIITAPGIIDTFETDEEFE
jgi:hypothetical protein